MYQSFSVTSRPEQGPARLAALRDVLSQEGFDGFLIPRADVHQGEYVAPRDERLSWLTGFTGSAGFCAALRHVAGVFIDGRYRTQVKRQVADEFTPVPWPEITLADWLIEQLPQGGVVAFDPWLHAQREIAGLIQKLASAGITLTPTENLIDRIWADQPAAPMQPVTQHPQIYAGESAAAKSARLANDLATENHTAALITQPDSIMWLLNLRGADIARNPVAHGFAILHADARVDLFMAAQKLVDITLPTGVTRHDPEALEQVVAALNGTVAVDGGSLPYALSQILGDRLHDSADPCALPKACKNPAEIAGAAAAHLRDGAAVVETLTWLDAQPTGTVYEIDVVSYLEAQRRRDPALRDISFETISGTGPNGAVMHYRVSEESNALLQDGHLLVLDSGGQYLDGTTDITRTLAIGTAGAEERAAFTRVLQGMVAISRLRWPKGLAGRDIEAIGRAPLWYAGQDFNHGLGHGVGAYLSVHEGPQRLSRVSHVPLQEGMILSNEPGYYREGAFGIRIENLIVVEKAADLASADPERAMLSWRTLTYVPIDRRLIDVDSLSSAEKAWLDAYHNDVHRLISPLVSDDAAKWLTLACAPL